MYTINAYQILSNASKLEQLPMKRDWMDKTFDGHAYRCFPLSLTNQMGWGFSFPKDITVIWDGNDSSEGNHIKVLEGNEFVDTGRGTATLIFNIGWSFKTDLKTSLLFFQPPNLIKDGANALTNIISTSFWNDPIPVSWKITRPDVPITFKANEPFMAVMPISITNLNDSIMTLNDLPESIYDYNTRLTNYANAIFENNKIPKWSNFYRNATDQFGIKRGEHETKKIKLIVEDKRTKNA